MHSLEYPVERGVPGLGLLFGFPGLPGHRQLGHDGRGTRQTPRTGVAARERFPVHVARNAAVPRGHW
jgi:hypothetical protein